MFSRLTITLKTDERQALHELALHELRDTGDQAAIIIRGELQRRGLISLRRTHATNGRNKGLSSRKAKMVKG